MLSKSKHIKSAFFAFFAFRVAIYYILPLPQKLKPQSLIPTSERKMGKREKEKDKTHKRKREKEEGPPIAKYGSEYNSFEEGFSGSSRSTSLNCPYEPSPSPQRHLAYDERTPFQNARLG